MQYELPLLAYPLWYAAGLTSVNTQIKWLYTTECSNPFIVHTMLCVRILYSMQTSHGLNDVARSCRGHLATLRRFNA